MKEIHKIAIEQNCEIFTDIKLCNNTDFIKNLIGDRKAVIISDENVYRLYKPIFGNYSKIIIAPGEKEKNISRIEMILNEFINMGVDKKSIIIGFGGGVVCDIAGFAASIYMRGTPYGLIASTLLAQVDAAIGGKNGVNLNSNKNFAGLINLPEFVICDIGLLKTLEKDEFKSGLAEVLKYALITKNCLFDTLLNNKKEILNKRNDELLLSIVKTCISIKKDIIIKDPFDNNYRHILNFGHSFGHAIETYDKIMHGQAIIKGMIIATDLSLQTGLLSLTDKRDIKNLISCYEYDTKINLNNNHFSLIRNDKKKDKKSINFVFLKGVGKAHIQNIQFDELEEQFLKIYK